MVHPRSGSILVAIFLALALLLDGCRALSRPGPAAINPAATGENSIPSVTPRAPSEPTILPGASASPAETTVAPAVETVADAATAPPIPVAETPWPSSTVTPSDGATSRLATPTRVVAAPTAARPIAPATATRAPTASAGLAGPLVGKPAPDFSLPGLDGRPVRLKDFRGQPVVVNFFATWCGPCTEELPGFQKTYLDYRRAGVQILLVDLKEAPADVRALARKLGLTMPIAIDDGGTVAGAKYRLISLPTTVFIDSEGIVRAITTGPLTAGALQDNLDGLLDGTLAPTDSSPVRLGPCCALP